MKKIPLLFFLVLFLESCQVSDPELFDLVMEIKNQNLELLDEVKSLKSKSDSLVNELKNSSAKQEEVLNKVIVLQVELAKVLSQIDSLNKKLDAQGTDIQEIKSQLADLLAKYQEILIKLEQLQKLSQILSEIEKLKGQLSDLDGKYQIIQGSLSQNKEQLDLLKAQISTLQSQISENLNKISQLTSQLADQGTDIEKILGQIEKLKADCAELKALLEKILQGKSPIPTNGLLGWWPFNGNANDESGNGNNGTIVGPVQTKDRFENNGKAFLFDGQGDYVRVKNTPSLVLSNSFTIVVWAKLSGLNKFNAFVSHASNLEPNKSGYIWGYSNFSSPAKIQFQAYPNFNNASGTLSNIGNNLIFNQWFMIACTYDKSTKQLKYYLNNNNSNSFTYTLNVFDNNLDIFFGNHFKNNDPSLAVLDNGGLIGALDDIAIYNRVLTDAELFKIYRGEGF